MGEAQLDLVERWLARLERYAREIMRPQLPPPPDCSVAVRRPLGRSHSSLLAVAAVSVHMGQRRRFPRRMT